MQQVGFEALSFQPSHLDMKKHHFSDVFYHYLEAKLSIQKKKSFYQSLNLNSRENSPKCITAIKVCETTDLCVSFTQATGFYHNETGLCVAVNQ